MRKIRCYLPMALCVGERLRLDAANNHHLLKVLRLRPDAEIEVFNGDTQRYTARLSIEGKQGYLHILSGEAGIAPSSLALHLFQGIGKGDHTDFCLQKATELGVRSITPVLTRFSDIKLNAERLAKKQAHWQAVVSSAAVQCERSELPILHPCTHFEKLPNQGVYLHPYADTALRDCAPREVFNVLIGPEGGLSPEEVDQLEVKSWQGLRLGPRILRMETATTAALAGLQMRFGDLY